jgi:hypothetical protein
VLRAGLLAQRARVVWWIVDDEHLGSRASSSRLTVASVSMSTIPALRTNHLSGVSLAGGRNEPFRNAY